MSGPLPSAGVVAVPDRPPDRQGGAGGLGRAGEPRLQTLHTIPCVRISAKPVCAAPETGADIGTFRRWPRRAWRPGLREAGLEPARSFPRGFLRPLRLPFRHSRSGPAGSPDSRDARSIAASRRRVSPLRAQGNRVNRKIGANRASVPLPQRARPLPCACPAGGGAVHLPGLFVLPPGGRAAARLAARDKDVLALDLHVTYWNDAAYRDPFALPAATARQDWYARVRHSTEVYTPQAVVDGQAQLVGSRAGALHATVAVSKHHAAAAVSVPVGVEIGASQVTITLGGGPASGAAATVLLFGYDAAHTTRIGGGENAGATLTEIDVVRSLTQLGSWRGAPRALTVRRPPGQHMAVLVQAADGTILGAAAR